MTMVFTAVAALFGYILGSIPFGLLITRAFGMGDVRAIGSGNIGATNVLRTGNKVAALLTVLLDGGKAVAAVLIARMYGGELAAQVAGAAALIGHCWPVWLGFKGGKGVATFIGLTLSVFWPVGLVACATWLVTAVVSRMSSLSALVSSGLAPVVATLMGRADLALMLLLVAGIIYWRHGPNIQRLRAGTEPKIGQGS